MKSSLWDREHLEINLEWLYKINQPILEKNINHLDKIVDMNTIIKYLENDFGFALIRKFDIENQDINTINSLIMNIGNILGTIVPQDREGKKIKLMSGSKIHENTLPFHTDRSDLLILLYLQTPKSGGEIKLASVGNIFKKLEERLPNDFNLKEFFPQDLRGEEELGEKPWMEMPIFDVQNDILFGRYNRRFIEETQKYEIVTKLNEKQIKILDTIDELLNDSHNLLTIKPEIGDMLLINNHWVWHSRESYVDFDEQQKKRAFFRCWVSSKNFYELPFSFKRWFRNVEKGSIRGGVPTLI